jgi:hypothetical protein
MLERVKKAFVESFVGAIAVAWLFAAGIMNFVSSFTSPLDDWLLNRMRWHDSPAYSRALSAPQRIHYELAIPRLIEASLILIVAYLFFRWLYLEPSQTEPLDGTEKPTM